MQCNSNKDSCSFAVEVSNASVQSKPVDGSDEKFKPWTPRPVVYSVLLF